MQELLKNIIQRPKGTVDRKAIIEMEESNIRTEIF